MKTIIRRGLTAFVVISLMIVGLAAAASPAQAQEPDWPDLSQLPQFVPGEVLVKFKPEAGGQNARQKAASVAGVSAAQDLPALGAVKLNVGPGRELTTVAQLQARADVEFAEPNYLAYAFTAPNDTFFSSQWGLNTIHLADSFDIASGVHPTIVAIVDTGIDLEHPDFACTVSGGLSKLTDGWNFVTDTNYPDDGAGHGTHVAGIVGACTDNGLGVTGVAPHARLMPLKVLSDSGSGTYDDVAAGIIYAVDNGAAVINLSLGGLSDSYTMRSAVQYAADHGVLVLAAAGNYGSSGNPVMYPAAYPETMTVAATTSADGWASFSGYYDYVDIAAPGLSIYSTLHNGAYGYKSGTSMATPFVAGLAALMWGINPNLSAAEVQDIIQATAADLGQPGQDIYFGHGRIDAYEASKLLLFENWPELFRATTNAAVTFLIDDQSEPVPGQFTLTLPTASVTWQAATSPPADWLVVNEPAAQQTDAGESSEIQVDVLRPAGYGQYSTTLTLTGVTTSGFEIGPVIREVKVSYVPQLSRLYFPIMHR